MLINSIKSTYYSMNEFIARLILKTKRRCKDPAFTSPFNYLSTTQLSTTYRIAQGT